MGQLQFASLMIKSTWASPLLPFEADTDIRSHGLRGLGERVTTAREKKLPWPHDLGRPPCQPDLSVIYDYTSSRSQVLRRTQELILLWYGYCHNKVCCQSAQVNFQRADTHPPILKSTTPFKIGSLSEACRITVTCDCDK